MIRDKLGACNVEFGHSSEEVERNNSERVPGAECWDGGALTAKEWNMLVLSRKKNESIVINNDITVVIVEIRGDKVRLGVEAPKEVPVHRREVYDAIKRNAAESSQAAQDVDADVSE